MCFNDTFCFSVGNFLIWRLYNLVKEFLPEYIRVSEELAKDRLLADRDKEEVAEQLSKCGMTIVQDETFYVEPKKENEQPS